MKKIIILNVYDDENHIVKQAEATPVSLMFGAVRKLMKLLKIENAKDTWDILTTVSEVWEELTALLSKCFPEMKEEDWDHVKLEELIPAVLAVIKASFNKLGEIPQDDTEKN